MVGHGGSSAGSYLADPTSPSPSTVHQLLQLALKYLKHTSVEFSLLSCCSNEYVHFFIAAQIAQVAKLRPVLFSEM